MSGGAAAVAEPAPSAPETAKSAKKGPSERRGTAHGASTPAGRRELTLDLGRSGRMGNDATAVFLTPPLVVSDVERLKSIF